MLFQDGHTSHIIVDEESESECEEEDSGVEELVLENGPTPTPQDVRTRFLAGLVGGGGRGAKIDHHEN